MSKKKEPENTDEEPGVRIAHLLIFILTGADVIRYDVLDVVEIDRDAIVEMADHIEKHAYEIAHLALGANIDEWKAEQDKKRNRRQGKNE